VTLKATNFSKQF